MAADDAYTTAYTHTADDMGASLGSNPVNSRNDTASHARLLDLLGADLGKTDGKTRKTTSYPGFLELENLIGSFQQTLAITHTASQIYM